MKFIGRFDVRMLRVLRERTAESGYGALMTTIAGLPAHVLLVHAIVVLAPLTAALEILCAIWPAARRRLVWLVLAFAAVNLVFTPLTTDAGEWLLNQRSPG